MSKKILECQYCGTIITENDTTCPKCGANCSKIIKEYKEEQNKEQEKIDAEKKELEDLAKNMVKKNFQTIEKSMSTQSKILPIFFAIPVIMFIVIAFTIFSQFKGNLPRTEKPLTGTINESITKDNYTITIDNYEGYEYYHSNFDSCNTKKGYQKIAFHFVVENKGSENVDSSSIIKKITLKAGDEEVDQSSLDANDTFCKTAQGKEKYTVLKYSYTGNSIILPGDRLSGYVGFEVPKSEPKLRIIINDSDIIEITNPAYKN